MPPPSPRRRSTRLACRRCGSLRCRPKAAGRSPSSAPGDLIVTGRTTRPSGNFERILPRRDRGYYREYTVPTPGESDRGARRIVAGDGGEKYYTDDHYETFRFIAE